MSESIIKTREHVKNGKGTYDTVYRETLADIVIDKDGNSAQDHINAIVVSDGGAHGFRYNALEEEIEVYDKDIVKWISVGGTKLIYKSAVKYGYSGTEKQFYSDLAATDGLAEANSIAKAIIDVTGYSEVTEMILSITGGEEQ